MRVIVNPQYTYLQEQIEHLPDSYANEKNVLYDGRNVLKRMSLNGVDVVVKSFKKPHIINRIVYSFFRQSKAARSYFYSKKIRELGFDTPEPIAMIEQFRVGFLSNSYYLCSYDDGKTVRHLMKGKVEGNEDKLLAFARYTYSLHKAGILHLDYSPGNILIHQTDDGQYTFSLVDVNRMQIVSKIDVDTVCQSMRRLCISREVLVYIMTEYASLWGWNVTDTVKRALYYSDKFFTNFIYRSAIREEQSKYIVGDVLLFCIRRSVRGFFSQGSCFSRRLWRKERAVYDACLFKYDYCHLLSSDYR